MRRCTLPAALLALLTLSGCGGGRDGGSKPPPPGAKKLTFWHIQTKGPAREAIDAAVARFRKAHPNVAVESQAYENDAFKQKMRVAMSAGRPPDVFYTWGGGVLADDARRGRVLDLSARLSAEDTATLHPSALEFCRVEGKLYALPADLAAVVFWYNRAIFKKHALEPPRTHAEFLTVCAALKKAGVAPVSLGNKAKWPGAFFFIYYANRLGGGEPFRAALARKPGGSFEHESFVAAGKKLRELVDAGVFTAGVNSTDYTGSRKLFFDGRAAMILMGSFILGNARGEAPEGFVANMGCFPFPAISGGKGNSSTVVGGVNAGYAVAARCASPELAVGLVRELTSVQAAADWAAKTGRIPARTDESVRRKMPESTRGVAAILASARTIQLYYDQALLPELGELHKTTTQGIFAGTKTPEGAARLMEEKARAVEARKRK
jgi:raffinose/stachyose/melibiose transport system substrate-binding protein